jgi:hypothetical protein
MLLAFASLSAFTSRPVNVKGLPFGARSTVTCNRPAASCGLGARHTRATVPVESLSPTLKSVGRRLSGYSQARRDFVLALPMASPVGVDLPSIAN